MIDLPDIDIDVKDRAHALEGHPCVPCSLYQDGELKKHPTGVCYQAVKTDPVTGAMSYPSGGKGIGDVASSLGYYKIDVLHSHAYDAVRDRSHLLSLLEEVDWSLFTKREMVEQVQQLGGHFDLVDAYEPKCIDHLACLVAVIRPGKRKLIGQPMSVLREKVWDADKDGYTFKKSHAYAYAIAIVVQMMSLVK